MLTHQRHQYILETLRREGQVLAKTLAAELGTSEDTIRRDLRELAHKGLLQRVHGGALPASPAVVDLAGRTQLAQAEKQILGRAAATLVESGQVVFMDGGTSTLHMARAFAPDLRATVVTHSPVIAAELIAHPGIEVVTLGGRLFKHSGVAVGAATQDAIRRIRADAYFLGVTGIHAEHGLSTGDLEEAHIKRAMIESAAEVILMATADKLGRVSPYTIAPLAELSQLLVTTDAPGSELDALRMQGVDIRVCN